MCDRCAMRWTQNRVYILPPFKSWVCFDCNCNLANTLCKKRTMYVQQSLCTLICPASFYFGRDTQKVTVAYWYHVPTCLIRESMATRAWSSQPRWQAAVLLDLFGNCLSYVSWPANDSQNRQPPVNFRRPSYRYATSARLSTACHVLIWKAIMSWLLASGGHD